MYPAVKTVKAHDDYMLSLTFSNSESGILDMKPYLDFGVFKRIKDYSVFSSVKVAFDTIEWSSVGVDLDPEFIYQHCKREL